MNTLVLRKLLNIFLVNTSRLLGLEHVFGYPFCMFIDPCTLCNPKCPMCVQTQCKNKFKQGFFPMSLCKRVLKHFGPYLTHLYLYNWGEPFLNRDTYEMIRFAKRFDIHVTVSTNLNVGDPKQIVDSGLDALVCSLDGATQETYEKYRVNGNLEFALNRAREIVRLKKMSGANRPVLIWQYLLFEHTRDEVEMAKELAKEAGFDHFIPRLGQVLFEHPVIKPWKNSDKDDIACASSLPTHNEVKSSRFFHPLMTREKGCAWLYSSIVFDPAGNVFPCCNLLTRSQSFCSIDEQAVQTTFNSERFRTARRYFILAGKSKSLSCPVCNSNPHRGEMHCEMCDLFKDTYIFNFSETSNYFKSRIHFPKLLDCLLEQVMK